MSDASIKIWNTCGYVRLSREDGDKEESNSVTGQKDLIRDFLSRHPELRECDMKVDDGYTGSNFDRPAFQKMMEAVRAGKINCIVVKDLSRFGRDHLEAGEYIERIRVCAQLAVEEKRLRSVEKEKREVQLQTLKQEIRSYQTLQQQITEESRILYEAYAMDGSMSRTEYADKKAALLARREKACEDEAAAKQRLESLWNGESKFIEKYKGLTDLDKLTAELAADLLRFIKIWPDGRVNVELNYLDEIPHAVVRNLLAAI